MDAGETRDRDAEARDRTAEVDDQASTARDVTAEARDERAESRGGDSGFVDTDAASDRAEGRRDREEGARDRARASHDRKAALLDRLDAASDRASSATELTLMSTDELTGAYHRGPGFAELKREIARARRTGKPLTLAFIDVDGLKERNDTQGHAAGDQVLMETAAAIRSHFRPYDLMIRYGGDEFVCVLFDMSTTETSNRFALVEADLHEATGASITIGLAVLDADDEFEDLLRRADANMYRERHRASSRTD